MDLETKRIDTYIGLEPTIQKLYSSPESGKLLSSVFEERNLPSSNYSIYVHIIGDAILGFYKTNEIPQKLQAALGMSADDAQRIVSDLSGFLAPVIERERAVGEPNREGLRELQQNFKTLREEALHTSTQEDTSTPVPNTAPPNLPTAQPLPGAEATLPTPTIAIPHAVTKTSYTVEPMRTMASDVTRIHGYGRP